MTVPLDRPIRLVPIGRFPGWEIASASSVPAPSSSSREDGSMLHHCRGILLAGFAAIALLFISARPAQAQDAVIRGTITSDRGEPVAGANVVVEELRVGVVTTATGQYTLLIPGARVRGQQVVVRVRGIGFKPNSKAIALTPGEQSVDLTLAYDVNLLEAVVVTGTQEATEAVKG